MEEEVNLGTAPPVIEKLTGDEEHSKFLNELREDETERLRQKWKKFFNEVQELETAIRPYDEKILMKKVMTKKEKKRMAELQKELKQAVKKKESVQKELRNR